MQNQITPIIDTISYDETIQNMFSNNLYSDEYIFYACMISKCNIYFIDDLDSPAGVSFNDSYNLYINLNKFKEYTLIERMAILKHEMLHILNGHLLYRNENKKLKNWNIATDCSINQLINSQHLPKNCITPDYIEKEINMKIKRQEPSEYYYELLNNLKDEYEFKDVDKHSTWELTSSESSEEIQKEITKNMIEESMQDSMNIIGEYPNNCSNWLKLYSNKSQINWKLELKNNLKISTKLPTIYRRNRRLPNRIDLKGSKRNKKDNILYIIDSSGSVNNKDFKELNSEIINLCKQINKEIISIQVDSEASEPEILTKNSNKIERKRDAGTFLSKGLEKADEHKLDYDTVIVSTDGYLMNDDIENFKKIKKKIIFLISKRGTVDYLNKTKYKLFKIIKLI